jgi:serine/threonine-protein kinase
MRAELWERLKPLFDEAVDLPAAGRAELLERLRGQGADGAELAERLSALLAEESNTGNAVTAASAGDAPLIRLRDFLPGEKHFFADGETVIGRFRIVGFLGRGGMGEVYRAEDLHLTGEEVALKTLRPEIALDPDSMRRFRQEVQMARRVTSTNVCRIHELFQVPGDLNRLPSSFLSMELLSGVTLAERIEREGALPFAEAESIALQLCAALQAIHDAGVIHRDFKSRNIMLTRRGEAAHAVVMDLGLARDAKPAEAQDSGITMTGAVMGTPEYMAPEQFEGRNVTPAADIYALGVVLYELATGVRPFQASTPLGAAVLRARRPAAASAVRAGVPKQWDEVINRCLEYEPEKRWASAREVAAALQSTASAPVVSGNKTTRVRSWLFTSAAIVAVLGAGGGIFWRTHAPGPVHAEPQQLVVLPFENVGGDPVNQALCDGLLEILTSATSETSALQKSFLVIPASEVRRDKIRNIEDARKAFNVNLALTGSVIRSGSDLAVTVSLSDASTRRQMASRIIRTKDNDENGLQTTLLSEVLDLLQSEMQPGGNNRATAGTLNSAAFDLYVKGQGYLRRFDGPPSVDAAIPLLEKAVQLDPSYALARAALAEAYFDRFGQTKDPQWLARADAESSRATELKGNLPQVHATAGLIMRGTGRYEPAEAEFRKAIELDAADFESQRLLARTLEDMGRGDEAEPVYLSALRAKPSYWPTARSLGLYYFRRAQYMKAEPWLKLVTQLVPENATGFLNLGILYYSTRRYSEAESALRKSIALEPLATAYTDLGTIQFFQRQYTDSVISFEKAVQMGPNDPTNWGNLADSYRQVPARAKEAGTTYEKATELARQQLAINPNDANLRSRLALYLARLGRRAESLDEIKKALDSAANNVNIPFNAAQVYEIAGNDTAAVHYLEEALGRGYPVDEALSLSEFERLRNNPAISRFTAPPVTSTNRQEKNR